MTPEDDKSDWPNERGPRGAVYTPDMDEHQNFEDDTRLGGRGSLILALSVAIIVIFGVIVWNAYRDGVKSPPSDAKLPVLGQSAIAPKKAESAPGNPFGAVPDAEIEPPAAPPARVAAPPPEAPGAVGAAEASPDETPPSAVLEAREGQTAKPPPAAAPAPKPANPAPANIPAAAIAPAGGAFMVQLGSVRTAEAAEALWADTAKALPQQTARVQREVERAELGAQGVFFRLRAGPFASRDAADAFCQAVKAAGRNCFVAAR